MNAKARYLSSAFVQADYEFNRKYLRGTKELAPRWKRCVGRLDYDLGEAIGQVFVAALEEAECALIAVEADGIAEGGVA